MANSEFQACIDACIRCEQECENCANSCLNEKDVQSMVECIRLDLDCATACRASVALMSRGSRFAAEICGVCATICEACEAECRKFAKMDHCRRCADACLRCATECNKMAGVAV